MTLINPQKAILHVAASKLKWDDDTYRMVLVRIAGATTSNDLDQAGFEAVMGFADYCGFRPLGKGAPRYGNRPGMATFAQLELIRELWRELHDQAICDDEVLTGWLLKYHKVRSMRFLTLDAARKAITALGQEGSAEVTRGVTHLEVPHKGGAARCRPSLFDPSPDTPQKRAVQGPSLVSATTLMKTPDPV